MIYISLGSNCSVTYWLNKLELRKAAYPFDWSNITMKQLNTILKNNFSDYAETLQIKFISEKYSDEFCNPSAVITNKYNVKFAHEVITNDICDFKKSLVSRVNRFNELNKEEFITYVRIELSVVKLEYINELEELIKFLDLINPNYIIKLIIHTNSIKIDLKKVKIHYFETFSPDWKMEHLNWNTILKVST